MSGLRLPMRVWDAPTRLFHWAVVVLLATSYVTVETGHMNLHFLSGYSMLALLLFRAAWGVVGSDTSRFSRFLTSPAKGLAHLRRLSRREPDNEVGHNAAGGWMVLLMLALLCVQVGTGLFANDDTLTEGPLAKYVGRGVSNRISTVHTWSFYVILGAAAIHVAVIGVYMTVKKQNLIRPMLNGKKRLPAAMRAPRLRSPLLAAAILAVSVAITVVVARL